MTVDNVWPYYPENGFIERYEHFTEVMRAYSAEQRLRLRKEPRLTLQYTHLLTQEQNSQATLKARRYGQTTSMLVPVWGSQKSFTNITSGQTTFDFGSEYVLYYNYNEAQKVIIWKDWNDYIVRDISVANTTADTLAITSSVGENIDRAYVMPLRQAVNYTGFTLQQGAPSESYMNVNFTLVESSDTYGFLLYDLYDLTNIYDVTNIYENPPEDYNSKYVQKTAPYRLDNVDVQILEPVTIVDNGFGPIETETLHNYINGTSTVEFFFQNQTDKVTKARDLFTGLKGRQKSFYLPTYQNDLVLLSGSYSGTTIDIEDYGTATELVNRAIMIKETDGTLTYRNIDSAVETTNGVTLTLDSSVNINSATVDSISFLNLVRFDTDTFEIEHFTGNQGRLRVNVIEVPN